MDVDYVYGKLKDLTKMETFDDYAEDIEKLVKAHNDGKIFLYPKLKLLAKQITLGLDNPYERFIKLLSYGRDSASLEVWKLRYGDEEGARLFEEKKSKCVATLEKYIERYGEVDGPIKYKEYCKSKSMSLEMCIKRHGEIEGPKVYRDYWDRTSFGMSKECFMKRYGDDWEEHYNRFCEKQAKMNTLEGKIEKYGVEEGTKRFNDISKRKSKALSKEVFVKRLLDKGASFDEIKLAIRARWSNTTLESFCSRYGEDEGKIKYEKYIENSKRNNPLSIEYYRHRNIPDDEAFETISSIALKMNQKINRISKESLKYFVKLEEIFNTRGYTCRYGMDELPLVLTLNEYNLYKKNRMFFYDFYVPDLNLIIEYHGKRFHDDIDYDKTIGTTAEQLLNMEYNQDFYKKWFAESRGYEVLILRSWNIITDLKKMFDKLNFSEEEKCILI